MCLRTMACMHAQRHLLRNPEKTNGDLCINMQEDIEEYMKDKQAHKVLLQVLNPYSSKYFPPNLISILKPPVKMIDKRSDPEDENSETVQVQLGLSKKDDVQRRKEILESGLGEKMCQAVIKAPAEYLTQQYGSAVVVELCSGGQDNVLNLACGEETLHKLHDAVIKHASDESMLTDYYTSRSLRRIILNSNTADGDTAQEFTLKLWKTVLKGKAKSLKDSHAAKIIAALVHSGCNEAKSGVEKELKKSVPDVDVWADKFISKGKA